MTIKAHCMGMEFPKRDTDSPKVEWVEIAGYHDFVAMNINEVVYDPTPADCERILRESVLPSAADLDAVAEEQRVKDKTS